MGAAGVGAAGVGAAAAGGLGGAASGIGVRPGAGAGQFGAGGEFAGQRAGTYYAGAGALDAQGAAVRAAGAAYPHYDAGAFAGYANAWRPANVASPSLYNATGYGALAGGLGLAAAAAPYDYGGNVVAQPSAVYVNGDVAGTPQEYAAQASAVASVGQTTQPAADSNWMPLGVFAVVEGNATSSDDVFQLAVNPQGIIRGNYHNLRTDQVDTISGSVDKKTQRTAWTIGNDQAPVYEAGIANLTKDVTPMLVQNADGQSHQMSLVRLPEPDQQANAGNEPPAGQQ